MADPASASGKIEELQKQIETLKQQAAGEVKQKLADARQLVSQLEEELAESTGKPPEQETRVRRPWITDKHLRAFVLKAMADHGKLGMNARGLADKVGQDALRVRIIQDAQAPRQRTGHEILLRIQHFSVARQVPSPRRGGRGKPTARAVETGSPLPQAPARA